jgi:hypothetical protein
MRVRTGLTGMAEAERQIRVARRLYEAQRQATDLPWEHDTKGRECMACVRGQCSRKISLEKRRPFIDLACQSPHVDCYE